MQFPKRLSLAAAGFIAAISGPALALDIPLPPAPPGLPGRVDISRLPLPQVVLPNPVIIIRPPPLPMPPGVVVAQPGPAVPAPPPRVVRPAPQPIYMWVPPGHRQNWGKHCHRYNACGVPVLFVRDDWYDRHVHKGAKHSRDDDDDRPGRGHGKGEGKSEGKGHGKGKD